MVRQIKGLAACVDDMSLSLKPKCWKETLDSRPPHAHHGVHMLYP